MARMAVRESVTLAGRATGVRVRAPQPRGESFAALLSDIAVPDLTWRWPTVAEWSLQVPLLVGGQSR